MNKGKIIEEFKKIPLPIYFQAYNKEAQSELVRFSKEVIQPFLEQALSQHEEEAYQRGCKDTEEAFGWQCEKFIEELKKMIEGERKNH